MDDGLCSQWMRGRAEVVPPTNVDPCVAHRLEPACCRGGCGRPSGLGHERLHVRAAHEQSHLLVPVEVAASPRQADAGIEAWWCVLSSTIRGFEERFGREQDWKKTRRDLRGDCLCADG